ncbi:MAG: leucine-rich repeat protein [Clostridia bacterium]|nr:leucine-rich repeat protein [Clostridia bacterium]
MKNKKSVIILMLLVTAAFLSFSVYATESNEIVTGMYEQLEYTLVGEEITITGCDVDVTGDITIPGFIQIGEDSYPVTAIAKSAFYQQTGITGISMQSGITKIGENAFEGCTRLSWIGFPETGLTEIPAYLCYGCENLRTISIPHDVQVIGDRAFAYCNLTEVYVPKSLKIIGYGAFESYSNKRNVYIEDLEAWCLIEHGDAYSNPLNSLAKPAHGTLWLDGEVVRELMIPCTEAITKIGQGAFAGCGSIVAVTVPDTVSVIESSAFSDCWRLQQIRIEGELSQIGYSAFLGCSSLSSIEIPAGVSKIESSTFGECTSLTSVLIPSSVTEIEASAFSGCSSLSMITIPKGVTKIGYSAFQRCSSLTEITIPVSVTEIGAYAFYKCDSLQELYIDEGVTHIGEGAFGNCTALTSVTIPKSVIYMEEYLFKGCSGIYRIYAPVSWKDKGNLWSYSMDAKVRYYCTITYTGKYEDIDTVLYGEDAKLPVLQGSVSEHYAFVNQTKQRKWDGKDVTEDMNILVHIETNRYTVYYQGDYNKAETVWHGETISLPENPEGGRYVFLVDGEPWSGGKITGDVTVEVSTIWNIYTVTYVGEYEGTAEVKHGDDVYFPGSPTGYTYIFTVDGEVWDGNGVTKDTIVTVTKILNTYTITYVGDYSGRDTVTHGESAVLPESPVGYTYIFTVDGSPWNGEKIYHNITVRVTKKVNTYTVTFVGDYSGSVSVPYGGYVIIPPNPTYCTYTFMVDGKVWDGRDITDHVTVTVIRTINTYTVTYVGDYTGTDTVTHGGSVVLPSNPIGYIYVFTVGGKQWDGKQITDDVTVTVTKNNRICTVTYVGDYTGRDTTVYGGGVVFPPDPIGYTYTFMVDGKAWDGNNITGDITVTVIRTINTYTVTYVGDYTGTDTVIHGGSVSLPENPEGYTYMFTADGRMWDGSNITGNVMVTVTKTPNRYTITYKGAYTGKSTALYGEKVELPVPPAGYVYTYTMISGAVWDGRCIARDVTITVTKLQDGCDFLSADMLHDVEATPQGVEAKSYYAYFDVENIKVSEGATVKVYESRENRVPVSRIYLPRETTKTVCYLSITAQSGRNCEIPLTIIREVISDLGEPVFESAIGNMVILHLAEDIPGNPQMIVYYSLNGVDWTAAETLYNLQTGQMLADLPWENTEYSIKIAADYGDMPFAESSIIGSVKTGITLSNACEILKVYDIDDTKIDAQNRSVAGKVASIKAQISLRLDVSQGATWKLYADKDAKVLLSNNTMVLTEGQRTIAYVKVTAEDGFTSKIYSVSIYRQKKTRQPEVQVTDGVVTVNAPEGSIIWYTVESAHRPIPGFMGREYHASFAVTNDMVVRIIACAPDCEEYCDMIEFAAESPFDYAANIVSLEEKEEGIAWTASIEGAILADGSCYFAAYNAQGDLMGLQMKTVTAGQNTTDFSDILILEEVPAYCRVYYWNRDMKVQSACANYPL